MLKRAATSPVKSHQSLFGLDESWASRSGTLDNNSNNSKVGKAKSWGESQAKQTESRQAMLEMAMRRRREPLDSDIMLKKANAAKAVALDRARIDEEQIRSRTKSLAESQTRQDQERQLRRLFSPIPTPESFIPEPWRGCDVTSRYIRKHACQRPEHWANLDFDSTSFTLLSTVCHNFAQLLKPYRDKEGPESEREAPLLTRPAFCRLLIDLNLTDSRGELIYHIALDMFDAISTQVSVRGCPMTAGSLPGIRVDEYDDGIVKLFTSLFSWILDDSQGVLTPHDLKSHVFNHLIPSAEKKYRRR